MNTRLRMLFVAACLAPVGAGAVEAVRSVDEVVSAAQAAVEKQLGDRYAQVELSVTARPERLPAIQGDVAYRPLPVGGHWPRARFTEMVEIRRGSRVIKTVPVGFALAAYAPAWVYREDVSERLPVERLALVEQRVDVAAAATAPVASVDALQGRRLRRPVRAGQVVSAEDFEAIPDVDNRQPVRLLASYGGITVERAGVAMRAGNKGEVVPVQLPGGEPVKATVTDRGVAQVVVP